MVDAELVGMQAQRVAGCVGPAPVDVIGDDRGSQDTAGVNPELVGPSRVGFQRDPREGPSARTVLVSEDRPGRLARFGLFPPEFVLLVLLLIGFVFLIVIRIGITTTLINGWLSRLRDAHVGGILGISLHGDIDLSFHRTTTATKKMALNQSLVGLLDVAVPKGHVKFLQGFLR